MIQVITGYRGVLTGEQFIAPGFYDDDDKALFGVANYLVKNGFAQQVSKSVKKESEEVDEDKSDEKELEEIFETPSGPEIETKSAKQVITKKGK